MPTIYSQPNVSCYNRLQVVLLLSVLLGWASASQAQTQKQTQTQTQTQAKNVLEAGTLVPQQDQPTELKGEGMGANKERIKLSLAWSLGFPTADLNDFSGGESPRGFDFNALWPLYKGLHVGASIGFNSFYQAHPSQTIQLTENSAVTAKLYRYTNYWSFAAVARYIFLQSNSLVRPYAGLRMGVAALSTETLVVDAQTGDNPVGFLLVPEIGGMVRITNALAAFLAFSYSFSTASTGNFSDMSFATIQLGLTLM